jgi:hypothetical protein
MMRFMKNKKGQQTAELAILIALVIAFAMAMQTYVKRGLQAKVRDAVTKYTTDTADLGGTQQYEPYYLESRFDTTSSSSRTEDEQEQGAWDRNVAQDQSSRTGHQTSTAPVDGG